LLIVVLNTLNPTPANGYDGDYAGQSAIRKGGRLGMLSSCMRINFIGD